MKQMLESRDLASVCLELLWGAVEQLRAAPRISLSASDADMWVRMRLCVHILLWLYVCMCSSLFRTVGRSSRCRAYSVCASDADMWASFSVCARFCARVRVLIMSLWGQALPHGSAHYFFLIFARKHVYEIITLFTCFMSIISNTHPLDAADFAEIRCGEGTARARLRAAAVSVRYAAVTSVTWSLKWEGVFLVFRNFMKRLSKFLCVFFVATSS